MQRGWLPSQPVCGTDNQYTITRSLVLISHPYLLPDTVLKAAADKLGAKRLINQLGSAVEITLQGDEQFYGQPMPGKTPSDEVSIQNTELRGDRMSGPGRNREDRTGQFRCAGYCSHCRDAACMWIGQWYVHCMLDMD